MVDPLVSQAGAAGVGGVSPGSPSEIGNGPGFASESDVTTFHDAMAGNTTPQHGVEGTQPGGLMQEMDKISVDLQSTRDGLLKNADGLGDMGNLIRLQFEVANLTTTQTMVGQVGQKSSQGTQQLLKGQ